MIIEMIRDEKDMDYFKNSFLSNKYDIPKAPGEGLFLRRIDYSKYNDRKLDKKSNIFITEEDEAEMDLYENSLIKDVITNEINEKTFSKWLWILEYDKIHIY